MEDTISLCICVCAHPCVCSVRAISHPCGWRLGDVSLSICYLLPAEHFSLRCKNTPVISIWPKLRLHNINLVIIIKAVWQSSRLLPYKLYIFHIHIIDILNHVTLKYKKKIFGVKNKKGLHKHRARGIQIPLTLSLFLTHTLYIKHYMALFRLTGRCIFCFALHLFEQICLRTSSKRKLNWGEGHEK